MDSQAVGFQVIAQSGVQERVHRLYISQTLPGQTSASVEVEESGEYLVSILPIMEGRGIAHSSVEYREIVTLGGPTATLGMHFITRSTTYYGSYFLMADTDSPHFTSEMVTPHTTSKPTVVI